MVEPFIPDDCPDYLGHFMTQTSNRLGDIETKLDTLIDGKGDEAVNPVKKVKNDEKTVTFKWLVEKLLVPAMFMAGGYLLGGGG